MAILSPSSLSLQPIHGSKEPKLPAPGREIHKRLSARILGLIGSFYPYVGYFVISKAFNKKEVIDLTLEGVVDSYVTNLLKKNGGDVQKLPKNLHLLDRVRRSVTQLNLEGCKALTDNKLMGILETYPNLTSLNLRECDQLTNKGLLKLSQGKKLQDLNLGVIQADDAVVQSLAELSLRQLKLERYPEMGCSIHDKSIEALCKSLECLHIRGQTELTDESMSHIVRFPRLRELNLGACGFSPACILRVSEIQNLAALNLSALSQLNDDLTRNLLKVFQNLTELDLHSCTISENVLREVVTSCARLVRFAPSENMSDEILQCIASSLPQLETLLLICVRNITTTGIQQLSHASNLRTVYIHMCECDRAIPSQFLSWGKKIFNFKVQIRGREIGMQFPKSLGEALASCQQLQAIIFYKQDITIEDLRKFFSLRNLRRLTILECGISPKDVKALQVPETLEFTIRDSSKEKKF